MAPIWHYCGLQKNSLMFYVASGQNDMFDFAENF